MTALVASPSVFCAGLSPAVRLSQSRLTKVLIPLASYKNDQKYLSECMIRMVPNPSHGVNSTNVVLVLTKSVTTDAHRDY